MTTQKATRYVCMALCALHLVSAQTVATADVIGAEQYINTLDRREALARVDAVLARSDVREQLERLGVDPDATAGRVAALNDRELATLAEELEELPAGGSLLGVVGAAFVVLLILELVGVTDVFSKI